LCDSLETVIDEELIRSCWKILVFINGMDIHATVLQNLGKNFHVFVTPAIMLSNEKILYK